MQDVIEHIPSSEQLIIKVTSLLKDEGIIYLSTPNRNSLINFIADPHWGFPVISVLNREQIQKYFLRYLRKSEMNRNDIAELLSLKEILELFSKNFKIRLFTSFALRELFNGNPGIVWSRFHLKLISFLKRTGFDKIILKISNDKEGILNRFFTPTLYFIFFR